MLLEDVDRLKAQRESFSLKQKLLQSVSGIVQGPAQAAAFLSPLGFMGSLATGAGFLALTSIGNMLHAGAEYDKLTNSYRDELARILKRDRNSITRDDLKQVALNLAPESPIRRDYEETKEQVAAGQKQSIIRSLGISAAVLGFAAIAGPLAMGMMGYAIIGGISLAVTLVTENTLGKWRENRTPTSAAFIDGLQNDMAKMRVGPTRLFEYCAVKNPRIKQTIRDMYHADYGSLSMMQKEAVIESLGQTQLLQTMADDVNAGRLRPSELPFLLSACDSPSTNAQAYSAYAAQTPVRQQAAQAERSGPSSQISSAHTFGQLSDESPERVLH